MPPVSFSETVRASAARPGTLDWAVALERAALEDCGLGGVFGLGIVGFEREEQRVIGVAREGFEVLPRRQRSMPADEGIIKIVQEAAGLSNALVGRIVKLRLEDQADGIAHREHAADTRGGRSPQG